MLTICVYILYLYIYMSALHLRRLFCNLSLLRPAKTMIPLKCPPKKIHWLADLLDVDGMHRTDVVV